MAKRNKQVLRVAADTRIEYLPTDLGQQSLNFTTEEVPRMSVTKTLAITGDSHLVKMAIKQLELLQTAGLLVQELDQADVELNDQLFDAVSQVDQIVRSCLDGRRAQRTIRMDTLTRADYVRYARLVGWRVREAEIRLPDDRHVPGYFVTMPGTKAPAKLYADGQTQTRIMTKHIEALREALIGAGYTVE